MNGSLSKNWKLFKLKWHEYAIITYLHGQQQQYKTAFLVGDYVLKVYNGFHFPTPDKQWTPEEILKVFDRYAVGEPNVTYECFVFHTRKQESKGVEAFITAL